MTVCELISVLGKYPKDAQVVALWDGGWSKLEEHSLERDRMDAQIVEFDVSEFGTYDDDGPYETH